MTRRKKKAESPLVTFWSRNCTGCARARRFFAAHPDIEYEAVDVRATPVPEEAALDLVRSVRRLLTKRGTRVEEVQLDGDQLEDETILELVVGRSRTMRAPALRVADTLMIGFDEDAYLELLGLD
jgi:arsenate reductase-like glutaredoxin family protein